MSQKQIFNVQGKINCPAHGNIKCSNGLREIHICTIYLAQTSFSSI